MDALDPDRNLTERLGDAVDGIEAAPDLAGVMAGADRRRRRSRSIGLGGATAVVALGVGGVIMVSNRDTNEFPAAQPDPVVVPLTTLPPGADTGDTVPVSEDLREPTSDDGVADEVPVSTIRLDGNPNEYDANAIDVAEEFLGQTDEIYRRVMPSGYDLQIRQSNVSYGELFGIEWDLPTGSQAECLGGPAVFIGNPDGEQQWSSWSVQQWSPIGQANDFQVTEQYFSEISNIVIRTELDGVEVGILQGDELTDSTEFVDGLAVIEMGSIGNREFEEEAEPVLSIAVRTGDGALDVQTLALYSELYGNGGTPEACTAPALAGSVLPEPGGEQPVDATGAEALVRERHAILVDRSDAEKPVDILTDDTGVAEARAAMDAGEFGESAAVAEYTIDEVVFTDAETAWFEYAIVAPTGTFEGRFGQAIFNGAVWQITRQTICQDLSLAGGQCAGPDWGGNLQPPLAGGLDEESAFEAWRQRNQAYSEKLSCNPLNPCGEFDLSMRLPEPGEQPEGAAEVRIEVIDLMESLYGDGALLEQLDRVTDSTGMAETVERLADGGFASEVNSVAVTVDELVFMSPTLAMFLYTLTTDGYTFTNRPGFADEVDGVWKIARRTVCNDLALGGSACDY